MTFSLSPKDSIRFERLRSAIEITPERFAEILVHYALQNAEKALTEAIREALEDPDARTNTRKADV